MQASVQQEIGDYLSTQSEDKRRDMQEIHDLILQLMPGCKLWFDDGRDESGKINTNPTVGYGEFTMHYAGGKTRQHFILGQSANQSGISIYVMGIADRKFLPDTYGSVIGKAKVTSYCVRFKSLKDIDTNVLREVIEYRFRSR